MTKKRLENPVDYQLTGQEPKDHKGFALFLDKLTDVPESKSLIGLDINEAGISNQQVTLMIHRVDGKKGLIPVFCDVSLAVNLPKDQRGIHMSRCEEALFQLASRSFPTLDAFAVALAQELRKRQKSDVGIVNVKGAYLHARPTRKSQKETHDKIYLLSEVKDNQGGIIQKTGLTGYNMTACPCTRTYTKFSVVPRLKELGLETEVIQKILEIVPTGTHTQRGTVTVIMDKNHDEVTSGALLEVMERRTHMVHELLKRPDEHDLVIRALQRPQFTEDVVRDMTIGIAERFPNVSDKTRLIVESVLNDSIHIHDVRTQIDTKLGTVRKALRS